MSGKWRTKVDNLWHPAITAVLPDPETILDSEDPVDHLVAKFWNGELPTPVELKYVVELTSKVLASEPNVLQLQGPITICGDIHGQFEDMLEIFHICGLPPYTRYLFLGDYVDRGPKSVEVIMLLCVLKLKFRDSVYILRGNHESMNITQIYGFRQEVLAKYRTDSLWKVFEPLFNSLPLAAVINNSVFCVHGGLSRDVRTIEDVMRLNRFSDIPVSGALCDLMWADPLNESVMWTDSTRNAGTRFGSLASDEFLRANNLKLIVRAHQVMTEGCEYCQDQKVLTVFSAPNYEPLIGNKAGICVLDENAELGEYIDNLITAWTTIAAQSEAFADKCVLKGLVPPHPGDLERALLARGEQVQSGRIRSDRLLEPTNDRIPEITPEEKTLIVESLRGVKNTLSQYVITKLHDQIPRISTRDMRNIVRSLILSGDVHQPKDLDP